MNNGIAYSRNSTFVRIKDTFKSFSITKVQTTDISFMCTVYKFLYYLYIKFHVLIRSRNVWKRNVYICSIVAVESF